MPTSPLVQRRYGVSSDLFVSRKPEGETIILGGRGRDGNLWTRVLTRRAAQVLWFTLTGLLFPERAQTVTAIAVTAPLRNQKQPTVTSHVEVARTADGFVEVIGWAGTETWWVRLPEGEARSLWTKLDIALYPVGWEGRTKTARSGAG